MKKKNVQINAKKKAPVYEQNIPKPPKKTKKPKKTHQQKEKTYKKNDHQNEKKTLAV